MTAAVDEIFDSFINPIKSKILSGVATLGQATAKQLIQMYTDIPQATLYRTLSKLVELEIIKVVEQRPKRGTVEKVYALNDGFRMMEAERIVKENDGKAYLGLFLSFVRGLAQEFDLYAKRDAVDIFKDGSGFSASSICVTRSELDELGHKLAQVIAPYTKNPPAAGRQNHTLALIFTPPAEREGDK